MFVYCYSVQVFPRPHSMQKPPFSLPWISSWLSVGWYKLGLPGWLSLWLVLFLIVMCNCLLGLVYMSPTFQFSHSVVSDSLRPQGLQHAGLPCPSQLPELTHTNVHRVGDAIQPSHPLSSPSAAFNLSQHQGLFKWVSSLHQVAKVVEFLLQHQSFQSIFRTDFL